MIFLSYYDYTWIFIWFVCGSFISEEDSDRFFPENIVDGLQIHLAAFGGIDFFGFLRDGVFESSTVVYLWDQFHDVVIVGQAGWKYVFFVFSHLCKFFNGLFLQEDFSCFVESCGVEWACGIA